MLKNIKEWWRGKPRELEDLLWNNELGKFKKPRIRIVLESIGLYIKKHSLGLLAIIVSAAITLFVHFDANATAQTSEKEVINKTLQPMTIHTNAQIKPITSVLNTLHYWSVLYLYEITDLEEIELTRISQWQK